MSELDEQEATMSVVVYVTREVVREVEVDVDPAEFAEWSGGKEMTPRKVQEFIEADRHFNINQLWIDGDTIDVEPGGYIEVQKLPTPAAAVTMASETEGSGRHGR